jgi:hypothetical protein
LEVFAKNLVDLVELQICDFPLANELSLNFYFLKTLAINTKGKREFFIYNHLKE